VQCRRKKHTVRNAILALILVLMVGGLAYGMVCFRNVKNAVNSSFKVTNLTKKQNINSQLKAKGEFQFYY